MLSFVKLLKVALPVATTTVATIATTFLVSFGKQDPKHIEENIDKGLDDFQKPSENFEDKKMYYSTKGKAEGLTKLNDEQEEEFAKRLKEQGDEPQEMDPNAIPEETLEGKSNSPSNSSHLNEENDPAQKQELDLPTSKDTSESIPETKDLIQNTSSEGEDSPVNITKPDGVPDDEKVEQDGDNNKVGTDEEGVQNNELSENGSQEHNKTPDDNGILADEKTEEGNDKGQKVSENSEPNNVSDSLQSSEGLALKQDIEPPTTESEEGSERTLNENGEKSKDDKSKEGVSDPGDDKDQERGSSLDSGHGTDEVNSFPHIPSEEELKTLLGLETELALVKSGLEDMLNS